MKLALVSDAWAPQVNGVVRTLTTTVAALRTRGFKVETVTPDHFRTIPCPTYPDIRLAIGCGRGVAAMLDAARPDAVHIATEGPLGWAARGWCLRNGFPYTTSFHTHFAHYLSVRTHLPARLFWPPIVRFHTPARRIFAATERLAADLRAQGLPQTHRWSRGVDTSLFTGGVAPHPALASLPRPIMLSVGRVAVEKNLGAFLALDRPGTKVIVGDGPARAALARAHPGAVFLGALHGAELAAAYAAADVFVFPSLTDTFGLVMIEALASGVPVAGFPVRGPLDVIGADGCGIGGVPIGATDLSLAAAIDRALGAHPAPCVVEARRYDWSACTDQFVAGLAAGDGAQAIAAFG